MSAEITTVGQLADCAANKLEKLGMARHDLQVGGPDGPVCIRGAMFLCLTGDARPQYWYSDAGWIGMQEQYRLWQETEDKIAQIVDLGGNSVAWWNNDPDTSPEDVVNVLRKIAHDELVTA